MERIDRSTGALTRSANYCRQIALPLTDDVSPTKLKLQKAAVTSTGDCRLLLQMRLS
jgi:hypothetical protein